MSINLDSIWEQLKNEENKSDKHNEKDAHKCKGCASTNLLNSDEMTCLDCGLIQETFYMSRNLSSFENVIPYRKTGGSNKIQKMQEWFMWTNEEKNTYKLTNYTKNLCNQLKIPEVLHTQIFDTVNHVINVIKQQEGPKRARVKDGIILVCIEYVAKYASVNMNINNISASELGKNLGIEIKYITKAEKIIMELVNSKKLILDKTTILSTESPFYYVKNVIDKRGIKIDIDILMLVQKLITYCEDNDVLLDHTPLSIGVCCLYYVLIENNITIDIKVISEIYNLSVVTILKTTNKIKQFLSGSSRLKKVDLHTRI